MVGVSEVSDLLEDERRDVLSIVLDVNPAAPEHQTANPAYRIWLHTALRKIVEAIPGSARPEAEKSAHLVLARVEDLRAHGRGLVIYAAPDLWREYVLPVPVPMRVEYGRPDLMPVLWAACTYKPYAIVVVDREHARIAVASLGQPTVIHEKTLEIDSSHWRVKAGRPSTYTRRVGVGAGRGAQRDKFDARVEGHVHKFWQSIAQATTQVLTDHDIDRVVIGGHTEAAHAVRDLLPAPVRAHVVGIVSLPSHDTMADIHARVLPVVMAARHLQESALLASVSDLTRGRGGAVVGRAATVEALLRGEVMTLVAARDLDGNVWECVQCGYVSGDQVEVCPACGGLTDRTSLRLVLPALAQRHGAKLEVVGPAAQPELAEGVGGLLRYLHRNQSASSASAGVRGA